MKKFLLIFIAALMLFAVGCGDSNNDGPKAPFTAATYEVGGVFDGDDIYDQVRREIVFLTETTFEMVQYDDSMVFTPEELVETFDVPADKIDFTGEHTITHTVYLSGTYTKDADKYSMKYNGQSAVSYKISGESTDKVRTLILDSLKLKGLDEEVYEVYNAAFESRYEIPAEEDTTTAEMKVTLADGKILFDEVKIYDGEELDTHVEYVNGIISKETDYIAGKVDCITEYNDIGLKTLSVFYNEDGSEESKTIFEYDSDNNLIRESDYEDGKLVAKSEYDAEGNCTLEEYYDENGNVIPNDEPEDEE